MMLRSAVLTVLLAGAALAPAAMAQNTSLLYTQRLGVDAVRQVQGKLNALAGYPGPVDGNWNPASETALRKFQQSRALQVTGEMNEATAATMGLDPASLIATPAAAAAAPPPPAPAQAFSLSADSMRLVQTRLRQLGFYTGAIDGVWGGGSQAALQSFQAAHSLPADGRLNAATVQAMGIDPATMQPPK